MIVTAVNRWLAALRIMHPTAFVVRALILLAGIATLSLLGSRSWNVGDLVWVFTLPLLVVSTVNPDSAAPVCFIGIVAADWVIQSDGQLDAPVVVCALLLLVMHLVASYAGQVPSYAAARLTAVRRWLLPATVAAGVAVLVAAVSSAADGRPGSLVLTCAALITVALLGWFVGAS